MIEGHALLPDSTSSKRLRLVDRLVSAKIGLLPPYLEGNCRTPFPGFIFVGTRDNAIREILVWHFTVNTGVAYSILKTKQKLFIDKNVTD